jgi:hypothetical protein
VFKLNLWTFVNGAKKIKKTRNNVLQHKRKLIDSNLIDVKSNQDYCFSDCINQRKRNNLVDHWQSVKTNKIFHEIWRNAIFVFLNNWWHIYIIFNYVKVSNWQNVIYFGTWLQCMITVHCIIILVSLFLFVLLSPFLYFLSSPPLSPLLLTLSFLPSFSLSLSLSHTHTHSLSPPPSTPPPSLSHLSPPPFLILFLSIPPLSSHTRNAPYIPIDTLLFLPFSTGGVNKPNSYTHAHTHRIYIEWEIGQIHTLSDWKDISGEGETRITECQLL